MIQYMVSMSLTGCHYHKPLHCVRPEPVEGPGENDSGFGCMVSTHPWRMSTLTPSREVEGGLAIQTLSFCAWHCHMADRLWYSVNTKWSVMPLM